jgi:hypothetical protein
MNDADLVATTIEGLTFFSKTMMDNGKASPMWSRVGIPYFVAAYENEHTGTLAYDVTRFRGAPETNAWLIANPDAVQRFRAWSKAWKPDAAQAP